MPLPNLRDWSCRVYELVPNVAVLLTITFNLDKPKFPPLFFSSRCRHAIFDFDQPVYPPPPPFYTPLPPPPSCLLFSRCGREFGLSLPALYDICSGQTSRWAFGWGAQAIGTAIPSLGQHVSCNGEMENYHIRKFQWWSGDLSYTRFQVSLIVGVSG